MKKLYSTLFLAAFAMTTSQAENKSIGYLGAITNIPGDMLVHVTSSFLKSINSILDSVGKAFEDASKNIEANGNVSK